jgi:nitroreductase
MKLIDILSRRSIRKYTEAPVSDEQIQAALEAAMAAPSARHCDPWHFIVVKSQEGRDTLADALPYGQMLRGAPVGIIVCGDINVAHRSELSYLLQDVSAAIENFLLAVSLQGLGAVWLGIHPNDDRIDAVKKAFNLPENIIPVSAIAIGHPAEHPEARTRFDAAKVHNGTW